MSDLDQPIDYDAIIRRAEALRAASIVEMGRAIAAYFRPAKSARKPLLG